MVQAVVSRSPTAESLVHKLVCGLHAIAEIHNLLVLGCDLL